MDILLVSASVAAASLVRIDAAGGAAATGVGVGNNRGSTGSSGLSGESSAASSLLPTTHEQGSRDSSRNQPSKAGGGGAAGTTPEGVKKRGGGRWTRTATAPRSGRVISPSDLVFRLSLLISLLLFSLCVLECSPPSWCVLLAPPQQQPETFDPAPLVVPRRSVAAGSSGDASESSSSLLSALYWVLLWADCLLLAAVTPTLLGLNFVSDLRQFCSRQRRRLPTIPSSKSTGKGSDGSSSTVHELDLCVSGGSSESTSKTTISAMPATSVVRRRWCREVFFWLRQLCRLVQFEKSTVIGTALGLTCTLYFLRKLDGFVTILSSSDASVVTDTAMAGTAASTVLRTLVLRLSALGVLISSALNGFGSVSLPHACLVGMFHSPVTENEVRKARRELYRVRDLLAAKREEAQRYKERVSSSGLDIEDGTTAIATTTVGGGGTPTSSGGVGVSLRRTGSSFAAAPCAFARGGAASSSTANINAPKATTTTTHIDDATVIQHEAECAILESMLQDLTEEWEEMEEVHRTALAARTLQGKLMRLVGLVFSVVLLVKLLFATVDVLKWQYQRGAGSEAGDAVRRKRGSDPITSMLLFLSGHHVVVSETQFQALSQGLSLLLTAILSISQIRNFLRITAAVCRRLPSRARFCGRRKVKIDDEEEWGDTPDHDSGVSDFLESTPTDRPPRSMRWLLSGAGLCDSHYQWHLRRHATDWRLLVITFVMGSYFLSCVVLLQMNIPHQYRVAITSVVLPEGMERIHFEVGTTQTVFVASSFASALTLGMVLGIRRQNSKLRRVDSFSEGCTGSSSGNTAFQAELM